jgi:glycosyltransferase involved in cell wall biosynthesis
MREHPVTVSAIMPTYNTARYLGEAIESILAQTFQDWELIIVDDGSSDDTQAVLARYRDPRIRTFRRETNGGRGLARNVALGEARGRYVAICDSDDVSLPRRFEIEVAFLESHPDIDMVSGHVKFFWAGAEPKLRTVFPESPEAIKRRFDRGQMGIAHGASLIRSTCFDRHGVYCADLVAAEDFELFLRMYRHCAFCTVPEVLVHYRHHVRHVPLRKWLFSARCHRYAIYRATSAAHNGVETFQEYTGRWNTRSRLWTIDLLRYLNYHIRAYVRPLHVLR